MNIATYREQTDYLRILISHYHSCVVDAERSLWTTRARDFIGTLGDCERKGDRDVELRELALKEVTLLLSNTTVEHKQVRATTTATTATTTTTNTMAFNYNKSPSRAVRLRRAAKTARKSACWH